MSSCQHRLHWLQILEAKLCCCWCTLQGAPHECLRDGLTRAAEVLGRQAGWCTLTPVFSHTQLFQLSVSPLSMLPTDAGVWRSHASSLQLPLQQPVNLSATALQLPSGAVAISITLSLDPSLKTAFVLHQAGLRPQFGLLLGHGFSSNSSSSSGVQGQEGEGLGGSRVGFSEAVPLMLVPGGTAGLSFLLLPDPGAHASFVPVASAGHSRT